MSPAKAFILLVDDDRDFIEINRHVLEPAGYDVVGVEDPQQALASMAERTPDLVITDLMMSNLDSGFSLARQIKEDERFRNVPIVIVTGVSHQAGFDFRPRTDADLRAMHADAFFTKPVKPRELLDRVAALLSNR